MIAPDGSSGDVPLERHQDAIKSGFRPAVVMTAPDGSMGYIPRERAQDALNAGFKVGQPAVNRATEKKGVVDTMTGVVGKLGGMAKSMVTSVQGLANPGTSLEQAGGMLQNAKDAYTKTPEDATRVEKGAMATGALLGADTPAMADAIRRRDAGGAIVEATPLIAQAVAPAVAKGVGRLAGKVGEVTHGYTAPVEEITGTTPARVAELKTFPEKIESVRKTVVQAEKTAHANAKASFPKFEKPIETGRTMEDAGIVGEDGKPLQREVVHTTTFDALQEERSNLLKQITDEKKAVSRGAAPRYDLANLYEKLNGLDETMSKAALDQGGPEGLAKLQAARQQFGQYMQDFHNPGSPLRKMLETKPGETSKVVNHFTSPDSGARSIEVLKKYGADTSVIQSMLQEGERPLKVTTNESAKLRKAGSEGAYKTQRMKESLSQLETSEMPTRAEARLPKNAQATEYPTVVGKALKGVGVTPKSVTKFRLKRGLARLEGD